MASLNEIKETRLLKLENLKNAGMNPYDFNVTRDYTLEEVISNFNSIKRAFLL
ncbi:MAG: hypothetical protein R3B65_02890 [Candidatus Paceibacterota bacterium]